MFHFSAQNERCAMLLLAINYYCYLKGKGTGQRVQAHICLGHFQLSAHYNFQSQMIERC